MAKPRAPFRLAPVERELSESDLELIVAAARQRAALVAELAGALAAGDHERALELARRVCGLDEVTVTQ
jgi:hypothetical protein